LLDDQLGDPVTASNAHGAPTVGVDQAHLDLAAIAGIDGARGVHDADAVLRCQSRSRVDERRVAGWQCDGDAGSHQAPLARLKLEAFPAV
jgi:hypothetical protein